MKLKNKSDLQTKQRNKKMYKWKKLQIELIDEHYADIYICKPVSKQVVYVEWM